MKQGFGVDFATPHSSLDMSDDFAVDTAAIGSCRLFEQFVQIRRDIFESNGRHGRLPYKVSIWNHYGGKAAKCQTQAWLRRRLSNFTLPAPTIAQPYKSRWQVELFFTWITQHLRIKAFYGTSANAVTTQVWIAVSVYALVAILKKRLALPQSRYTILQVLSVTLFERMPSISVLTITPDSTAEDECCNQLSLFD